MKLFVSAVTFLLVFVPAAGPVPLSVFHRLKKLEDRILELEGLSPEYFQSTVRRCHLHVTPNTVRGSDGRLRWSLGSIVCVRSFSVQTGTLSLRGRDLASAGRER